MHQIKADSTRGAGVYLKAGVLLGLTALTLLICFLTPPGKAGGEAGVDMNGLPYQVGPLMAYSEDITKAEHDILPKDTTFARKTYGVIGSARPDQILCSIILSGAERRSIHRPERCLPGQGWRIDSSTTESVPLASGHNLEVTALLLEKHVTRTDGTPLTIHTWYLYWFVGKGITTPHQTTRVLMTYWDMLVHRVNQRWAYVIVSKDISADWNPNGMTAGQTLAELKDFIRATVPSFMLAEKPADSTASN